MGPRANLIAFKKEKSLNLVHRSQTENIHRLILRSVAGHVIFSSMRLSVSLKIKLHVKATLCCCCCLFVCLVSSLLLLLLLLLKFCCTVIYSVASVLHSFSLPQHIELKNPKIDC